MAIRCRQRIASTQLLQLREFGGGLARGDQRRIAGIIDPELKKALGRVAGHPQPMGTGDLTRIETRCNDRRFACITNLVRGGKDPSRNRVVTRIGLLQLGEGVLP